jgi:hypothetical protein
MVTHFVLLCYFTFCIFLFGFFLSQVAQMVFYPSKFEQDLGNAVLKDYMDHVRTLLINNSAHCDSRVNRKGSRAIHLAAKYENLMCLELLLEYGCDSELPDGDGLRALDLAVYHNRFSSVQMLLEYGSNPMEVKVQCTNHKISQLLASYVDGHSDPSVADTQSEHSGVWNRPVVDLTCDDDDVLDLDVVGGSDIMKEEDTHCQHGNMQNPFPKLSAVKWNFSVVSAGQCMVRCHVGDLPPTPIQRHFGCLPPQVSPSNVPECVKTPIKPNSPNSMLQVSPDTWLIKQKMTKVHHFSTAAPNVIGRLCFDSL